MPTLPRLTHPARRTGMLLVLSLAFLLVGLEAPVRTSAATPTSSATPTLVGPADLRISGGAGTYRWSRIEFGVDEVTLDWSVAAGSSSCTVTARTVSHDGRVSARDAVSVPARVRRSPDRTLAVGYLSGRLVVSSTCPSWRLTVRAGHDPQVPVSITQQRYRVSGDTAPRLWRSMISSSPWGWPGYTSWRWSSDCGEVAVKVWLPEWSPPAGASSALVRRWKRFVGALRRHELGHVTIMAQVLGRGQGCLDVAGWGRVDERSESYDRLTDHGRTQGAFWTY